MRNRLVTAACILLWLSLSILMGMAIVSRAVLSAEHEFDLIAQRLSEQLAQRVLANETILDSYAAFATLDGTRSKLLEQEQEQAFVQQLLGRYPQLVSLERIDRVTAAELPAWQQRMMARWGQDVRLHAYAAASQHRIEPLPAQAAYYPIVSILPLNAAVRPLLAADLSHDPQLQQALHEVLRLGRTAMSAPFQLREGVRGYILLRPLDDASLLLRGLSPQHFIAMVLKADALCPRDAALPAGLSIQIRSRQPSLAGQPYVRQDAPQSRVLDGLGFPHLRHERQIASDTQPLTLVLDWQLGWFVLSPFEQIILISMSLLLLSLLLLGLRFYHSMLHRQQRRESHLFYLANHDRLTGLANRNLFYDRLQHATSRLNRNGRRLAVLFLDMDRFKPINDSYGHAIGDKVLQLIAARIQAIMRAEDTVARLGGDEFVLLMEDVESNREADKVVERLKQAIQQPYEVEGHQIRLGVSIGVAYYPEDGMLIDELLDVADRKMYGDKPLDVSRSAVPCEVQ